MSAAMASQPMMTEASPTSPSAMPASMPLGNGGPSSLVAASYGDASAGSVVPISRNDPDGLVGGPSVTQEVLELPSRGAEVLAAMYGTASRRWRSRATSATRWIRAKI
jgi:hypothetical protein